MPTPEEIIAEVRAENRRLRAVAAEAEQVAHDLRHENDTLRAKESALQARIERMCRRIYGASSERHDPGQQQLDLGIPVAVLESAAAAQTSSSENTPAASSAGSAPERPVGKRPQAGRHPGRRALPANAEIVIEDLLVPEHERLDIHGQPLPLLGYRTTDKWDYRRGTYLIRRYRRAIYGQPFSEASDRIVAPAPICLIPQGKMTDAALIHTVIEKFADHLPLYRQQQRAGRTGVHLSRATLVGQVAAVAQALQPIVDVLATEVRAAPYVHLDDTPVDLLDPGRGQTATARIWVYRSSAATVFRFSSTREGRHPADFLGAYRGFIVADAYAGHERLYGPTLATPVGCWAHVRRKFHDIHHHDAVAQRMVEIIQGLYTIEDDLCLAPPPDRQRIRQQRSVPLLAHIRQRLDQLRATTLPSSDLGRAVAYAVTRWPTLTTYTDHGFLPIDNNPAENALRPWAIGRKNWLFFGSVSGGERAATLATIIENCRLHALDPYAYLCTTVAALHTGRTDYAALTPQATAARQDAGAA